MWSSMRRVGLVIFLCLTLGTGCGTVITPPLPTSSALPSDNSVTPTNAAAAAFLTPIPPTPTLTPSPTPTPVFYTVQSGDTLLGIALEYGISLEALQRANGLDDSQFLSIGQALIIPLGDTVESQEIEVLSSDSVILPTPTPLPLEIMGVSLSRTAVGGFLCMGEVLNNTDLATTNLQVQAVLVDGFGTPLVSGVTLASADYLAPGERAPFTVLFQDPPEGAIDVQVQLLRAESLVAVNANFVPLTVIDSEGGVSGPQYRVAGRLLNETDRAVGRIKVVAVLYNADAQVIGYREALLGEELVLAVGEEIDFSLLLISKGVEVPDSFRVLAWGSFEG